MNLFEAQEFFQNMHPGKKIDWTFPKDTFRTIELVHTEGKPNIYHHVECNKVCMNVEGQAPIMVPIAPHRHTLTMKDIQTLISFDDFHFPENTRDEISKSDPQVVEDILKNVANATGKNIEQVRAKL